MRFVFYLLMMISVALAVGFGRTEATPQGFVSEGKLGDEPIAIGVSRAA